MVVFEKPVSGFAACAHDADRAHDADCPEARLYDCLPLLYTSRVL